MHHWPGLARLIRLSLTVPYPQELTPPTETIELSELLQIENMKERDVFQVFRWNLNFTDSDTLTSQKNTNRDYCLGWYNRSSLQIHHDVHGTFIFYFPSKKQKYDS